MVVSVVIAAGQIDRDALHVDGSADLVVGLSSRVLGCLRGRWCEGIGRWNPCRPRRRRNASSTNRTLCDRSWTAELRLKGEKRGAFVRRVLLGEVLHGDAVESDENETAY
jgi:hypothetical protein